MKTQIFALLGICLVGLLLRVQELHDPWSQSDWRDLNALYAAMARNHVEQGYLAHGLAPAIDSHVPAAGQWTLFLHHPLLQPVLLSFCCHAFGTAEWSIRLLPVLCSLLEIIAVFAIAKSLFGPPAAWIAAGLCATLPATAFYGSSAWDLGPMVIGLGAASFALCLRFLRDGSQATLAAMCGILFVALGCDWPAYYTAASIACLLFAGRHRRAALAVCTVTLAALAFQLLVTAAVTEVRAGSLFDAFVERSLAGASAHPDPWSSGVGLIGGHLCALYTVPVLVLAVVGFAGIRGDARRILPFALACFAHTLVFLEGAARHEFWVTTAAPAILPAAAHGVVCLGRVGERAGNLRGGAVLLALGLCAFGTWRTCTRIEHVRGDRYHHALALAVRERTAPGDRVGTPGFSAEPLRFYSRRRVIGRLDDSQLPESGLPVDLSAHLDVFVVPEVPYKSVPTPQERVLRALADAGFRHERVEVEGCGGVHFFYVPR